MKKKILFTIIATIILAVAFVVIKNWIYGTKREYIADYMPSPSFTIGNTTYPGKSGSTAGFPILAHKRTMIRLIPFILSNAVISIIYTIILFKRNVYQNKKDILYTCIVFLVPLLVCYFFIYSQFGYTV